MKLKSVKNRKPRPKLSIKALRDLANRNGKYTAKLAFERAMKYNQCPPWARKGKVYRAIEKIYIEAQILKLTTGKKYEVDHIVPLFHFKVRGLHVPGNLQILSRRHNKIKSNHFRVGFITPSRVKRCKTAEKKTSKS